MPTISDLTPADLAEAHALNQANTPHVSSLTADAFADTVERAQYRRVLRDADGPDAPVIGFILGMTPEADYGSPNFQWFRTTMRERFAYCDRIAVDAAARGRGFARLLYADMADWARSTGATQLTAEINSRPPNPLSQAVHERLGFRVIGELVSADGEKAVAMVARPVAPG
jgi:predicted GNAT superfamily acetyltransferase